MLFSKVIRQKKENNILYAKCNAFQNATLILLESKDINLFLEHEAKLIEQYCEMVL